MALSLDTLSTCLQNALGDALVKTDIRLGELTAEVRAGSLLPAMQALRDHADLRFSQLIDLCGMDYSDYKDGGWDGPRFAVVYHLLSIAHNVRMRVRVFCTDDDLPVVASVTGIWPAANWFEDHPDLRRILTDYGFVGHPFRKDFPLSGHVEMRYDPVQQRVIYQPVSIERREITPRIVREEHYGEGH